jgi:hypothetical protein
MRVFRFLLLLPLAVILQGNCAAEDFSFKLNGKPVKAWIASLNGTPNTPAVGDVAWVGGHRFVLDDPGVYDLRSYKDREDLFRISADGTETLFAAVVTKKFEKPGEKQSKSAYIDPLTGLDARALAAVRGLRIAAWPPEVASQITQLDLAHCLIELQTVEWNQTEHTLGKIPKETKYLVLRETDSATHFNRKELSALKNLSFLDDNSMEEESDLRPLATLGHLRLLEVHCRIATHAEALSSLTGLRSLELRLNQGFQDLAFIRPLRELRRLSIAFTPVEDLTALGELPALEIVEAQMSAVRLLPEKSMASLQKVNLLGTAADERAVAAFQKINPQCEVGYDWEAPLQKMLASSDRVRVVLPRREQADDRDKPLAEEKDAGAIAELVGAFIVDQPSQPFHCMCDGSPWLEFYRGDKLLTTISVQHGLAIRWSDGWPADRRLVGRGQDTLTAWLAHRGARGPAEELLRSREAERAGAKRMESLRGILPATVFDALEKARDETSAAAAFTDNLAAGERAEAYLRLFGCDLGSWSHGDQFDGLIREQLLPQIAATDLAAVKLVPGTQATNGLARWLFFERKWKEWKRPQLDAVLETTAREGLTHPRPENRRKTIIALGEMGNDTARQLLRMVLRGELQPRALPADAEAEIGGMVTFIAEPQGLPSSCPDNVHAAICLAKLADPKTKEERKTLIKTLKGEERIALEKARPEAKR